MKALLEILSQFVLQNSNHLKYFNLPVERFLNIFYKTDAKSECSSDPPLILPLIDLTHFVSNLDFAQIENKVHSPICQTFRNALNNSIKLSFCQSISGQLQVY